MPTRIVLCGGNGAGKSTLGRALANATGFKHMDIEEYYFPDTSADYTYASPRTRAEVIKLLLADMRKYDNFIFSAVKGSYGEEIESMFTLSVYIDVPRSIRLGRVRDRSFNKFGDRILPGGDLYEREEKFFDIVENRSDSDVLEWIESLGVPSIRVDGTLSVGELTASLLSVISQGADKR